MYDQVFSLIYEQKNAFNADYKTFFNKIMQNQTLKFKVEECHGGKF